MAVNAASIISGEMYREVAPSLDAVVAPLFEVMVVSVLEPFRTGR